MNGPQDYEEIDQMPLTDVQDRYQALTDRDGMARAIATQQARGTWKGDGSIRAEDYPPLTADEHLEMIALGERLARYYAHPALVHYAVTAGASWEQIAAAAGGTVSQARQAYAAWAAGQRRLRQDFPGGTIGLDAGDYDAAVKAVGEPPAAPGAPAEDARRLDAIRAIFTEFDWEHNDRQYALEQIERIIEGGPA
jgi:hypothetical protein